MGETFDALNLRAYRPRPSRLSQEKEARGGKGKKSEKEKGSICIRRGGRISCSKSGSEGSGY